MTSILDLVNQTICIATLDPNGRFLSLNQKLASTLGFRSEELIGSSFAQLPLRLELEHLSTTLQMVNDLFQVAMQTALQGVAWKGDLVQVGNNGQAVWFEANLNPQLGANQEISCVQFIGFDITERKAVESSLMQSEHFTRHLMESAPVGIFLADVAGSCNYINPRWRELSGLSLHEAVVDWETTIHPDDRKAVSEAWSLLVTSNQPFQMEYRYLHPDGRIVWVLSTAVQITDPRRSESPRKRTRFIRTEKDRTAQKQAQQLLDEERMKSATAAKMSSLSEMAGGIAHEINNPLAIILLRSSTLKRMAQAGPIDPQAAMKAIENIEATTARIAKIIKSMRAIARDGEKDSFESASIKTLIDDTIELCATRFKTRSIDLTVGSIDEDLKLDCRPVQIAQILLNLLNNAYDATEEAAPAKIHIEVTDHQGEIEIAVEDNGHGVPSEIHEKIFQPFFTTKPVGKGMGLGLSLSRSIIEDHGGQFGLRCKDGRTRFVVRLPKTRMTKPSNQAGSDRGSDPSSSSAA